MKCIQCEESVRVIHYARIQIERMSMNRVANKLTNKQTKNQEQRPRRRWKYHGKFAARSIYKQNVRLEWNDRPEI